MRLESAVAGGSAGEFLFDNVWARTNISKPVSEACFSGGVRFDAPDETEYTDWVQDIGSIGGIIVMPAFMKCVWTKCHE